MTPSAEQLALLALLTEGRLRQNRATASAVGLAVDAGWAIYTGRPDEVLLVQAHRASLEARLDVGWPDWRTSDAAFRAAGLPSTTANWRALKDAERRERPRAALPDAMNRRTAAAALRDHSKANIGDIERATLGDTVVTHDNLLRLRPHAGLVLTSPSFEVDGATLAALCGEVCVTDRGFRAGTRLGGRPPVAILLVENLGVYVDVLLPDGWCAAHVPGWNLSMVTVLRAAWPDIRVLIFGDLDPNGVAIARSLQGIWPGMIWFIPSFADEYMDRAQRGKWPYATGYLPAVVRTLAETGRWLEQEVFVLDERLQGELEAYGK